MKRESGMTDKIQDKPVQRRGLFAAIGLSGAAAVATSAAVVANAEAMTPPAGKGGAHYTESDHVKTFYRVNRY